MIDCRTIRRGLRVAICTVALAASGAGSAHVETILDVWKSVELPPPPELQPATVDSRRTALLIVDMYPTSCNATERPSCVPTIPHIQHLLGEARAHDMAVIYTAGPVAMNGPTAPVDALAPKAGEPTVRAPADKFLGSDLEAILAGKGIKTVIVAGTSADGAVLYTASHAAMVGLKAVVPVDCISSKKRFSELYAVFHLKNTGTTVSNNVTLTRTDMIGMR